MVLQFPWETELQEEGDDSTHDEASHHSQPQHSGQAESQTELGRGARDLAAGQHGWVS